MRMIMRLVSVTSLVTIVTISTDVTVHLVLKHVSQVKTISTGKLYTIDNIGFVRNLVPTISLEVNHPFCALWQSFLGDLTNGCDTFWDAMMRIYTGHTAFSGNRAEIQQFKVI